MYEFMYICVCVCIELMLIFHRFSNWVLLLQKKCICNCKINTHYTFVIIFKEAQSSKQLQFPTQMFPAGPEEGDTLSSCSCSHIVSKYPFAVYLYHIICNLLFLLMIILFKMSPNQNLMCCVVSLSSGRL
jgi:hypothetical protein